MKMVETIKVLAKLCEKYKYQEKVKELYKQAAEILLEKQKEASRKNNKDMESSPLFPDIYYHYIELLDESEAMSFIGQILEIDNTLTYALNFKAEILRKNEKTIESDDILKELVRKQKQEDRYNAYTFINYTENLIERLKQWNIPPNQIKETKQKIETYQNTIRNLPTIINQQLDASERTLTLSEAKEKQQQMEDITNGLIHAKLAEISYIRNPKKAQKELNHYFWNEFQIVDSVDNSNTFWISLMSRPFVRVFWRITWNEKLLKRDKWLWVYLLEKRNGEKLFVFRGTEVSRNGKWKQTDIYDIMNDAAILTKFVPFWWIVDFIDLVKQHIAPWEPLSFVWHSLWWYIAQMASVIYESQLKASYIFNAPWFNNTQLSRFVSWEYQRLKVYEKEIDILHAFSSSEKIWERVVNYDSVKDSLLWKYNSGDIGRHVVIQNENHSISEVKSSLGINISNSFENQSYGDTYIYKQATKLKRILEY